ncbi:MAG TPA: pilus assembly protein PilP, partial [Vicinamibacterales bacterium]|nr:pilus assembly protein PilP [Vicinamibacterales bacterium]
TGILVWLSSPPVGVAAAPAQAQAAPPPPLGGGFTYDPQGRRDPFVSLLLRGNDPRSMVNRAPGLPGVLIGELTVKGIVRDRSGFIAMVQAPDNKTYIVRPGEKLMDGSVKSITPDTVVFSQDVSDPLSPVKQREIRKSVRATDQPRG